MARYSYSEYATYSPSNRGKYLSSNEVIHLPFKQQNRFKEFWRSMFLYENNEPNEEQPMFGNFYIESDEENFDRNKDILLDVSTFLHRNYDIPYYFMDYFMTNRSLWLVVPAKVFGCYGSKKLHLIYKSMAYEVQQFLQSKGYSKALDMSIYKWNGLIHSLGSYLPQSQRWVSKFSFYDLEDCNSREELSRVSFDNGTTFSDLTVITKAKEWFTQKKEQVFNFKKNININTSSFRKRPCMDMLEERGYLKDNRNLHIYSYSLYLKEQGLSFDEALIKIEQNFNDDYIKLPECKRTIQSAFVGNKHFSCSMVEQFLDEDLHICGENRCSQMNDKTTFIVPRSFFTELHKNKVHYNGYKYLISVYFEHQINQSAFYLNIKQEKHKKDILRIFEKLSSLGFISYCLENDTIKASLIYQPKSAFKSHIVFPNDFVYTSFFENSKKEFKLYIEILRTSILLNDKYIFNTRLKTLSKNLGSTLNNVKKQFNLLKRNKMIFRNHLFIRYDLNKYKTAVRNFVKKCKAKLGIPSSDKPFEKHTSLIIKCIYSPFRKMSVNPLTIGVIRFDE